MSAQGADEAQEQGSENTQDAQVDETQSGSDVKSDKAPDLEQLMKENKKYRDRIRELKPLAEKWTAKENAEKSEAQLLKEQLEKLREDSASNLKKAIAAEEKLPAKLLPLLSGSEDEMREQAKVLAAEFGGGSRGVVSPSRPSPVLSTGQTSPDNRQDVNDWFRSLAGK